MILCEVLDVSSGVTERFGALRKIVLGSLSKLKILKSLQNNKDCYN